MLLCTHKLLHFHKSMNRPHRNVHSYSHNFIEYLFFRFVFSSHCIESRGLNHFPLDLIWIAYYWINSNPHKTGMCIHWIGCLPLCVCRSFSFRLFQNQIRPFPMKTKQNRRKPENLTPPLSSDGGSSTSGQSPTSTHNGSPPPAVKRPPLGSDKYTSSNDYPTSKKQRISHYRKDIVNHQDINIGARSKYHDL